MATCHEDWAIKGPYLGWVHMNIDTLADAILPHQNDTNITIRQAHNNASCIRG